MLPSKLIATFVDFIYMVPCMPSNSNHSHLRSLLLCPFGGRREVSEEFLALFVATLAYVLDSLYAAS